MPRDRRQLLTGGFGHGPLGIVYALHRLHGETRDATYLELAREALARLEIGLDGADPSPAPSSWCRGSSGSLGALVRIRTTVGDHELDPWIARLTERTLEQDLMVSDCLCHGELGNLDGLRGANPGADGRRRKLAVERRERAVWERAGRDGWTCATPVVSPGFMEGLAGIGYQLLRSTAAALPSVLYLEGPPEDRPPRPVSGEIEVAANSPSGR